MRHVPRRPGWRRLRLRRQGHLLKRKLREAPRRTQSLELLGDLAQGARGIRWTYPLFEEDWRCFAGYLPGALAQKQRELFFELVRTGTTWLQPSGRWGPLPLRTAWMCQSPCSCRYRYGGAEVLPVAYPDWMTDILAACMPLCGIQQPEEWPNSCNLNLYMDGAHSVGWHADNEALFQGKVRDCRIISLSLGQTREFELMCGQDFHRLELADGDLCTMEGMTQKYYKHRVPKMPGKVRERINLTWRWVVQHKDCACEPGPGSGDDREAKPRAVMQRKLQQELSDSEQQQRLALLLAEASEEEAKTINQRVAAETKAALAESARAAEHSLYTRWARRLERLAVFSSAQGREDNRSLVQLEGLTVLPNEDGSNALPARELGRLASFRLAERQVERLRDCGDGDWGEMNDLKQFGWSLRLMLGSDSEHPDCEEHHEAMPEEEVSGVATLPLEETMVKPVGYKWHAQIVADDFFNPKLCFARFVGLHEV
ncbi:unnamed protein product [Effrenium voratum]|nr:unnamed protein product [Effrenium voratum]